jgi:hypothetical protein
MLPAPSLRVTGAATKLPMSNWMIGNACGLRVPVAAAARNGVKALCSTSAN